MRALALVFLAIGVGLSSCAPKRSPAEPPGPMVPAAGDPLELRTDFLTLRYPGDAAILYSGPFPVYSAGKRQRILAAHRAHGYTDYWLDVLLGEQRGGWLHGVRRFDFLDRPRALRPFLTEIRAAGLRPILVIGFEDNLRAARKYGGDRLAREVLPAFVRGVDDLASAYLLGPEVREYWSWDRVLELIEAIGRNSTRPILIHQNQRQWGPDRGDPWSGGDAMAWWRAATARAPRNRLALAYQCGHAPAGDDGDGFLADQAECTTDIGRLLDASRLGGLGVTVIAGEYAHRVSESKAKRLGAAALAAGAAGFTNGGPQED